jgi:Glycosyltransferase family 10 (fucosyltransferase) C-term
MLVRIIKNWSSPNLMRQTPSASGHWSDIRFTLDPVDECDAVIVLNLVSEMTTVHCAPENVWALMQEPYVQGESDWMVKGHGQYAHVFTHHPANSAETKYIRCQPAVPWHVNKSYDDLKSIAVPDKQKSISWITSNLTLFPGHKSRMVFLDFLRSQDITIDLYGKGINYIEDKWDGLAPYRYSLAIENSSGPDYWTEKLADCFLSWSVPIYYGCTNLEEYFPAASFIRIDINQPEEALEIITTTLTSDNWKARLPALVEARSLILERYQFFPQMQNLVERHYKILPKKNLVLQPYRKRHSFVRKIRGCLSRLIRGK